MASNTKTPRLEIVQQPVNFLRFRHGNEQFNYDMLMGMNSTSSWTVFPRIKIVNLPENTIANVVISCVAKDPPYEAHPHELLKYQRNSGVPYGKIRYRNGVCAVTLTKENPQIDLTNIYIYAVSKEEVRNSLKQRQIDHVDPFRVGFVHRYDPETIDFSTVRLAFQTYIENSRNPKDFSKLNVVLSDNIHDIHVTQ